MGYMCLPADLLTWVVIATAMADKISSDYTYANGNADNAAIEIARLSNKGLITAESVKEVLNSHGIGYAHLEKLDKTPIDAYTTFRNDVPVIFATYRINDADKFAFDILHELGHIALHIEKGKHSSFININGMGGENALKKEADSYAKERLIPMSDWKRILNCSSKSLYPTVICKLIGEQAASLGYSPSVAVSRYKHESNVYNVKVFRSKKIV